tara:strand:+ start:139 stop:324 length:186 start_codon:yes stop_codon:yes gene_type:complete
MKKKIKKIYTFNDKVLAFRDIDSKLMNGWQCQHFSQKQKDYFDKVKLQTRLAMENQKYLLK